MGGDELISYMPIHVNRHDIFACLPSHVVDERRDDGTGMRCLKSVSAREFRPAGVNLACFADHNPDLSSHSRCASATALFACQEGMPRNPKPILA